MHSLDDSTFPQLVCGFFKAPLVFNWNNNCTSYVDAFGDAWTVSSGTAVMSMSVALLLALIALLLA